MKFRSNRGPKKRLSELLDEKCAGAKIRFIAKHLDTYEKPTRFFFRREKIRGDKAIIKELSVSGVKITDKIQNIINRFMRRNRTI